MARQPARTPGRLTRRSVRPGSRLRPGRRQGHRVPAGAAETRPAGPPTAPGGQTARRHGIAIARWPPRQPPDGCPDGPDRAVRGPAASALRDAGASAGHAGAIGSPAAAPPRWKTRDLGAERSTPPAEPRAARAGTRAVAADQTSAAASARTRGAAGKPQQPEDWTCEGPETGCDRTSDEHGIGRLNEITLPCY